MPPNRIPLIWGLFLLGMGLTIAAILLTSPQAIPTFEAEKDPRVQTFEDMKADGGQGIYVEDQAGGASVVEVGFAVCSSPCFVAIFDDVSGLPGKEIGTSTLLREGGEHVSVELTENLKAGGVYYAMLRKDNGDGAFSEGLDAPLTNATGVTAIMTFLAKDGAEPETEAVLP